MIETLCRIAKKDPSLEMDLWQQSTFVLKAFAKKDMWKDLEALGDVELGHAIARLYMRAQRHAWREFWNDPEKRDLAAFLMCGAQEKNMEVYSAMDFENLTEDQKQKVARDFGSFVGAADNLKYPFFSKLILKEAVNTGECGEYKPWSRDETISCELYKVSFDLEVSKNMPAILGYTYPLPLEGNPMWHDYDFDKRIDGSAGFRIGIIGFTHKGDIIEQGFKKSIGGVVRQEFNAMVMMPPSSDDTAFGRHLVFLCTSMDAHGEDSGFTEVGIQYEKIRQAALTL